MEKCRVTTSIDDFNNIRFSISLKTGWHDPIGRRVRRGDLPGRASRFFIGGERAARSGPRCCSTAIAGNGIRFAASDESPKADGECRYKQPIIMYHFYSPSEQ